MLLLCTHDVHVLLSLIELQTFHSPLVVHYRIYAMDGSGESHTTLEGNSVRLMITFTGNNTIQGIYKAWDDYITLYLMKHPLWPPIIDIWRKNTEHGSWGLLGCSSGQLFKSTIDELDHVMAVAGFKYETFPTCTRLYKPIDPDQLPTRATNNEQRPLPELEIVMELE